MLLYRVSNRQLYSILAASKKTSGNRVTMEIVRTTCRLQFSAFFSVSKFALGGERTRRSEDVLRYVPAFERYS